MALRELLAEVGQFYGHAMEERLNGHPMGSVLRVSLPAAIKTALGQDAIGLAIEGSAGRGNWARVPWVAAFEPSVTESATRGYYPVYLFNIDAGTVHLSLNQGTTKVRREFGSLTGATLRDRAELMRRRVKDFEPYLPVFMIDLGTAAGLGADYAAGHALGLTYEINELPTEEILIHDLRRVVDCYRALIFRGGLDFSIDETGDDGGPGGSIDEERRYKMHRRIERNPKAAKLAKAFHGCICQACDFDFVKRYGEIGKGFIEAHHLKPIATLAEETKVRYDIATDFAVLCANCHRMIHKMPDPSDVNALKEIIAN